MSYVKVKIEKCFYARVSYNLTLLSCESNFHKLFIRAHVIDALVRPQNSLLSVYLLPSFDSTTVRTGFLHECREICTYVCRGDFCIELRNEKSARVGKPSVSTVSRSRSRGANARIICLSNGQVREYAFNYSYRISLKSSQ